MSRDNTRRARALLDRLVSGYQEARIVMASCRLGIFDALDGRRASAPALAARLHLVPRAAETLLNALASLGLLVKKRGLYSLSSISSRHLAKSGAEYRGDLFLHQGRMADLWSSLEERVKGGPVAGWEDEREAGREFIMAMEANAGRLGKKAAVAVDLSGVRRLLDLGGGPGTYGRLFLARRPDLAVTLFDRPEVVAVARRLPANRACKGRLRYRAGDFLTDDLGRGYDLIWASNVIHSLAPEEVRLLLGRCRAALRRGGRLTLHDFFLDPSGTRPPRAAIFSVHMLVVTASGRSWGLAEALRMMEEAGFANAALTASFENTAILQGWRA